jgi:hypothetical protein
MKKGLGRSVIGIAKGLFEIFLVARYMIITFSGMRNHEARTLPYHCLEEEKKNGKMHYFIAGGTTKFNHGKKKRTRWVTNGDGARAIRIVQKIATMVYRVNGVKPSKTISLIDKYPLFVSPGYLGMSHISRNKNTGIFVFPTVSLVKYPALRKRLQPLIEEGDLRELEQIDPHRAWRSEKDFQVGAPWRFTAHQQRRSLALYAQRSGLVSLPSLRRQLQHITQEMSQYYAKGSAFARNFVAYEDEHFHKEWQRTVPVSSALSYIINVILSDDTLFGGHGNYVAQLLKDGRTVVFDRDTTMDRFKKGEIEFKETPLGGCVKVGECDKVGLNILGADCIKNCTHLVGKLAKLERVIIVQTNHVSNLNPTSGEFHMEKSYLDAFISVRDRIVEKKWGTA